jgi:hypothetical protein
MNRSYLLLALALPLAACSADPTSSAPAGRSGNGAATVLRVEGVGGGAAAATDASACGDLAEAPAGTPACGAGSACSDDADCAQYAGNYCALGSCAQGGCLSGACAPTKVMGAACSRAAECWSGECDCTSGPDCVCAPGDGGFTIHFP